MANIKFSNLPSQTPNATTKFLTEDNSIADGGAKTTAALIESYVEGIISGKSASAITLATKLVTAGASATGTATVQQIKDLIGGAGGAGAFVSISQIDRTANYNSVKAAHTDGKHAFIIYDNYVESLGEVLSGDFVFLTKNGKYTGENAVNTTFMGVATKTINYAFPSISAIELNLNSECENCNFFNISFPYADRNEYFNNCYFNNSNFYVNTNYLNNGDGITTFENCYLITDGNYENQFGLCFKNCYVSDSYGSIFTSSADNPVILENNVFSGDCTILGTKTIVKGNTSQSGTFTFGASGSKLTTSIISGNIGSFSATYIDFATCEVFGNTGFRDAASYTPTLTRNTNITTATLAAANYSRQGEYVTVNVVATITPTAASTCSLAISLPIPSNLGNATTDVFGHITPRAADFTQKYCEADTTNDRVNAIFVAAATTTIYVYFTFTYKII